MANRSVAYKNMEKACGDRSNPVAVDAGIASIKAMTSIKADRSYKNGKKRKGVDQTVELVIHLGIDPRQADQMLRGAISLPKGIGKSRSVIAFCEGPAAEEAKAAGAIEVGGDDLVKKVTGGWMDFDVAVAHPSMMGKVGKLGRVLGPSGKMPSPKAGTVTADIGQAVKDFTAGRIEFRNDAGGNIHLPVGKASFADADLKENIEAALDHFTKLKPTATKGVYFKRVALSATHTPSVTLEMA